jgi:hypothetical protein
MSDFSLTLVLQIKTSKIINGVAKVQQKSEKISAFGGIFFVLDKFDRILSSVIYYRGTVLLLYWVGQRPRDHFGDSEKFP